MLCNLCYEKKAIFYLDCYCVFCEECYERKIKYYIQKDQKQHFEKKKRKCRFCQRITNYKQCDSRIASDLLTIKQLNLHPERANLRAVETSKFHFLQKKKNIKFLEKKSNFLLEMINYLIEKNKMIHLEFPESLRKKDNFGIIKKVIKKYKTFSFDNTLGSENPNMMEIEHNPIQLEEMERKDYFEKNDRNKRKRQYDSNIKKDYYKSKRPNYYQENERKRDYNNKENKIIYEENNRNIDYDKKKELNENDYYDKSERNNKYYKNLQKKKNNFYENRQKKSISDNSRMFYEKRSSLNYGQSKENIQSKNRRFKSRSNLSKDINENRYDNKLKYNGDNTKKYFGFKLKGIRDSGNSKKRNSSSRQEKYRLQNILLRNSNYNTPLNKNR